MGGQENYVFNLKLNNGRINWDKLEIKSGLKLNSNYIIILNKLDYLPCKITMGNGPYGTLSRTINNLKFDHEIDDRLWTGTFLPKEFRKITFFEYLELLKSKMTSRSLDIENSINGLDIETWKLPNLESNEFVEFSKLKGNVVLLEFWFKNCGPCVQAIPELNSIQNEFKDENFFFFGVEFREDSSRENLTHYVRKLKMAYPILYKGKILAAAYGVTSAPTFMIIDKGGNVIYTKSGFNSDEIMQIIQDNL